MSAAAKKIVRELTQELKKNSLPYHAGLYNELNQVFPLIPIGRKQHYENALRVLTMISKAIASEEYKQAEMDLRAYAETLGLLVESYEKAHYPTTGQHVSGTEMLAFLMEQHGLLQSDLARDLGGQPNVSAILSGKRKLNAKQMEALAKRFNVSPAVFFSAGESGSTKRDHRSSNLLSLKKS
jgi:HTH-type transcriptional regulator/antitoxin HigA